MKYSGLRDRHLNVFVNYASDNTNKESEHLENNITKAFINTLESLPNEANKKIFKDLFEINLPDDFSCKYYLQWSSSSDNKTKEIIKKIPKENRILFAFSPTGKPCGFKGIDTKNFVIIKQAIKDHYKNEKQELSYNEFETKEINRINETYQVHDGESIPDALIIVYFNNSPQYAIAMENKKYDLDPYQLNNHLEKSLDLNSVDEKDKRIKYKKYKDIINSFKGIETYMTNSFIEYMIILDYYKSDNFVESFNADKELRQRICFHFGKDILNRIKDHYETNVGKKLNKNKKSEYSCIDKRGNDTWRLNVKYPYLKEINLVFREENVFVSLCFGSTQSGAKEMYPNIDPERFRDVPEYMKPKRSFHLMYHRGRNIPVSYVDKDNHNIHDYIKYWKTNVGLIKKTNDHKPQEAVEVYEKMMKDGIIKEADVDNVRNYLSGKKNDVLVVPEFLFEPEWTYEEIANLGEDAFIEEIKERIKTVFDMFGFHMKA